MNLLSLAITVLVAIAVACAVVLGALAFWTFMLLVRASVEVACRVAIVLVRYGVERDKLSTETNDTDLTADTDLREVTAADAPQNWARSDSWPDRTPVLSGARRGGDDQSDT